MTQLINEAKRFQKLAGILLTENEQVAIVENKMDTFEIQLKIDGKPVMTTTADGNPSPEELTDTLTTLESRYGSKFDFNKAEIVVLDPKGEQVGSITKQDNFLRTKAKYAGDTYPQTHGTV